MEQQRKGKQVSVWVGQNGITKLTYGHVAKVSTCWTGRLCEVFIIHLGKWR